MNRCARVRAIQMSNTRSTLPSDSGERLVVAAFGLMLVGSELPSRWDILTRASGWIIVAAAAGLVEFAMAAYYRARGWIRSFSS
jgi:hypothetical protein